MSIYRIFPVLWNDGICQEAHTVYAIDRAPNDLPTACSTRVKEDPAYYWDSRQFYRLLPPEQGLLQAVNWSMLPAWLSYAQTRGYTCDLSRLKPQSDIYITGPY
jgi:hypothetical protein